MAIGSHIVRFALPVVVCASFLALSRPGKVQIDVNKNAARETGATVAVVGFEMRQVGEDTAGKLSNDFSDIIALYLKKAGYRIVERSRINVVWREQMRQLSKIYDQESAIKIGKLLKARFVVYGTSEVVAAKRGAGPALADVIIKMVNVETGEVVIIASWSGSSAVLAQVGEKMGKKILKEINKKRKH